MIETIETKAEQFDCRQINNINVLQLNVCSN